MKNKLNTVEKIKEYLGLIEIKTKLSEKEFVYLTVFCILEEIIYKELKHKDHHHSYFYLVDYVFVLYIASNFTHLNYTEAIKDYEFFAGKKISLSRLSHVISDKQNIIQNTLNFMFKTLSKLKESDLFIIDSFPLEIGKLYREKQLSLIHDLAHYKGYNASKKTYFLGFKVLTVTDIKGNLVFFMIDFPPFHDKILSDYSKEQIINLISQKKDSIIIGDKGFTGSNFILHLKKQYKYMTEQEKMSIKKHNSLLNKFRKIIETSNSLIYSLLPRKIHATSIKSFIFKVQILLSFFNFSRLF